MLVVLTTHSATPSVAVVRFLVRRQAVYITTRVADCVSKHLQASQFSKLTVGLFQSILFTVHLQKQVQSLAVRRG